MAEEANKDLEFLDNLDAELAMQDAANTSPASDSLVASTTEQIPQIKETSVEDDLKFLDQLDAEFVKMEQDPVTGLDPTPLSNGLSPETPINKSPLSGVERAQLSFSNEEGKLNFLKEKFEDVKINKQADYVVSTEGRWHVIDKKGFDSKNPYEFTAEVIGDLADVTKEASLIGGGMLAAAVAAPLAAGAAFVSGSAALGGAVLGGVAGAGGVISSLLGNTVMGKLTGTNTASAEELLKEATSEGVLNAMGVFIAPAGRVVAKNIKKLKPFADAAVVQVDEIMDVATGQLKKAGVIKVFDEMTTRLAKASGEVADSLPGRLVKNIVGKPIEGTYKGGRAIARQISVLGGGQSMPEMEYAASRSRHVKDALIKVLDKSARQADEFGGKVSVDPQGALLEKMGNELLEISAKAPKALQNRFGKVWDEIQTGVNKAAGTKVNFDVSSLYDDLTTSLQRNGFLDQSKKLLPIDDIAMLNKSGVEGGLDMLSKTIDTKTSYNKVKTLIEVFNRRDLGKTGSIKDLFRTRGEVVDLLDDIISQSNKTGHQQLNRSMFALKEHFEGVFEKTMTEKIGNAVSGTVEIPKNTINTMLGRTVKGAEAIRGKEASTKLLEKFRANNNEYRALLDSSKKLREAITKDPKQRATAAKAMYDRFFYEPAEGVAETLSSSQGIPSAVNPLDFKLQSNKYLMRILSEGDSTIKSHYQNLIDQGAAASFAPVIGKRVMMYQSLLAGGIGAGAATAAISDEASVGNVIGTGVATASGVGMLGLLAGPRFALNVMVGPGKLMSDTAKKAAFKSLQAFKQGMSTTGNYFDVLSANPAAGMAIGQGILRVVDSAIETEAQLKQVEQAAKQKTLEATGSPQSPQ